MSGTFNTKIDPGEPMIYQVRIEGRLGNAWTNWFDGFTIRRTDTGNRMGNRSFRRAQFDELEQ